MDVKVDDGGKTVDGRAEIETEPPFRSVKEAVSLFGETVLAGDFRSRKLKQMIPLGASNGHGHGGTDLQSMTAELEETKQSLEKAREEAQTMASQMSSLREQLEKTRRELQELKESQKPSNMVMADLREIEELKFVKDSPKFVDEPEGEEIKFQKKRYVTFAHPTLSQIVLPEGTPALERQPSLKKKKKKPLVVPLIGGIFPKRKTKFDL